MRESNIPHIRPSDILLASYPRSGNTWMMNILYTLGLLVVEGYNDDMETANGPHDLPDRPYHRRPGLRYLRANSPIGAVSPVRFIKTHNLANTLPPVKAVYLYRDGRDAVLSHFHYRARFSKFDGDLTDFLQSGYHPAQSWAEHIESWMPLCARGEALAVRYENLLADPVREVNAVVHYVGVKRSEAEVRDAIERCCFSNLQSSEAEEFPGGFPPGVTPFFRRGIHGGWRDEFTPEQLALFMEGAQDTLQAIEAASGVPPQKLE